MIVLGSDVKLCFVALNVRAPINHQARGSTDDMNTISASPDLDEHRLKESISHYGITEERKYIYTNPAIVRHHPIG
jgi:hypothetical protein